jgi:hypothetical protein
MCGDEYGSSGNTGTTLTVVTSSLRSPAAQNRKNRALFATVVSLQHSRPILFASWQDAAQITQTHL